MNQLCVYGARQFAFEQVVEAAGNQTVEVGALDEPVVAVSEKVINAFGDEVNNVAMVGSRRFALYGIGGREFQNFFEEELVGAGLLYTSPSPRDGTRSRRPSSA